MYFVCILQAAEFGVSDLVLPIRFRAIREGGRPRANERVLVPLSRKVKAEILERGLLMIIGNCEVVLVRMLLTFAIAHEIHWLDSEMSSWFLSDFALVLIITVPKWNADGCTQERHGDTLSSAVYPKVVKDYIDCL